MPCLCNSFSKVLYWSLNLRYCLKVCFCYLKILLMVARLEKIEMTFILVSVDLFVVPLVNSDLSL